MQPMSSGQEWLDSLVTRCPECGEIQQPGALKCHQCQAELPAPAAGPMVGAPNEENATLGFQRNDLGIWDIPR